MLFHVIIYTFLTGYIFVLFINLTIQKLCAASLINFKKRIIFLDILQTIIITLMKNVSVLFRP